VSPEYTALIECEPLERVDVENDAVPPLSVAVPIVVAPSRKLTEPVIVPLTPLATVAVNVTEEPALEILFEELTLVDVAARLTTCVRLPTDDVQHVAPL